MAILALARTVAVEKYPAGAIIAVMLTEGRSWSGRAEGRARRDLSALLSRAPTTEHREEGAYATADAAKVRPGNVVLVRSDEVVPVDGRGEAAGHRLGNAPRASGITALIDESAVTGEARSRSSVSSGRSCPVVW